MYRFLMIVIVLLTGLNDLLNAKETAPVFTIEGLVEQAIANNAELQAMDHAVNAAKGLRRQAGIWKNPQFTSDAGGRNVQDQLSQVSGNGYTVAVGVTQTFEFPGKASLRKAIANKNIEIAELGLQQFRIALEGQVRNLAMQYLIAEANANAAEEIAHRSSELIKMFKQRSVAGVQQLLELRVIEGSVVELHQAVRSAMMQREDARAQLNALVGVPFDAPIRVKNQVEGPSDKIDMNHVVLLALDRNYQLRIRKAELERAMKEVSSERLQIAPDFQIGPFYSRDVAGDIDEKFGGSLSASIPIWDWNQGNVEAANARRIQADAMMLNARRVVEGEVVRRVRFYWLAQEQLGQFPPDLIKNLREAAALADRQYRTGAIDLQLYLNVQQQFLNAQRVKNQTILEAWQNLLDIKLLTDEI